jgi:hypothetical protein
MRFAVAAGEVGQWHHFKSAEIKTYVVTLKWLPKVEPIAVVTVVKNYCLVVRVTESSVCPGNFCLLGLTIRSPRMHADFRPTDVIPCAREGHLRLQDHNGCFR